MRRRSDRRARWPRPRRASISRGEVGSLTVGHTRDEFRTFATAVVRARAAITGDDAERAMERALRDAWVRLRGAGPGPPHPAPPDQPVVRTQLRSGTRRHSVVLPAPARIGLAVVVSVGLGRALGLGHAYWVALTATAVLRGSNLAVTRRRVVHRVAGTIVGVVGPAFAVLGLVSQLGWRSRRRGAMTDRRPELARSAGCDRARGRVETATIFAGAGSG